MFLPALASIAHHGEFTGRGSVICTLHSACLIRKLAGYAIRNAEVGIHRDPDWELWQVMSTDEKLLRRRAWWGMYIWDK